jgi:cytochrome c peroxidase
MKFTSYLLYSRLIISLINFIGISLIACRVMAAEPQNLPPPANTLTSLQSLGQQIFFDRNLSQPGGTACASCHNAGTGFADNHGSAIGVPLGSVPGVLGLRNAMSNAYGSFIPPFHIVVTDGNLIAAGGLFRDGRVDTLALQALVPLLSSQEMNNTSQAAVVQKIAAASYANQFKTQFGTSIFINTSEAFQDIGVAIAAYESTQLLQQFSSKYDLYIQGKVQLTANETRGMNLFIDPARGNCASCHTMNPNSKNVADNLFADFSYHALGIPRNKAIPANVNPSFYDLGLCGPKRQVPALPANAPAAASVQHFCGAFRTVSLRNVALRNAFMHNGFFKDLQTVIDFYSTRNSDPQRWYGTTGIPNDLPVAYLPNIIRDQIPFNRPKSAGPIFNPGEISDLLAFLSTLSDDYANQNGNPPKAPPPPPPPPAQSTSKATVNINPFSAK